MQTNDALQGFIKQHSAVLAALYLASADNTLLVFLKQESFERAQKLTQAAQRLPGYRLVIGTNSDASALFNQDYTQLYPGQQAIKAYTIITCNPATLQANKRPGIHRKLYGYRNTKGLVTACSGERLAKNTFLIPRVHQQRFENFFLQHQLPAEFIPCWDTVVPGMTKHELISINADMLSHATYVRLSQQLKQHQGQNRFTQLANTLVLVEKQHRDAIAKILDSMHCTYTTEEVWLP